MNPKWIEEGKKISNAISSLAISTTRTDGTNYPRGEYIAAKIREGRRGK